MIPPEPKAWLVPTLRSTAWLAITVVFLLCGWNQWWALVPFATGLALAIALACSLAVVVPKIVAPHNGQKNRRRMGAKPAILVFALVKYPMVATIIWWIVDRWEQRSVIAFAGGFACLQMVIGLRAAAKAWTEPAGLSFAVRSQTVDEGNAIAAGSIEQHR